jgi:hypothetical protein
MRKLFWFWSAGSVPTNLHVPIRAVFALFTATIVASFTLLFATACSRPPRSEARNEHRDAISNAEGLAKIEHIVFIIKENISSVTAHAGSFSRPNSPSQG